MNQLERYIARNIIAGIGLVLVILLALQTFIQLIGELRDIGVGNYGIMQALVYVPMQLPQQLYQFFPVAALLGGLLGLSRLAAGSELIVMRASGVSIAQVIFAVIKTAVLVLIVVTAVGEWLAPPLSHAANIRKTLAMSNGQALKTQQGTWLRDGQNFLLIGKVLPNKKAQDVTYFTFNKQHKLQSMRYAAQGDYHHHHWTFKNIEQSTFQPNDVTTKKIAEQQWPITFNPRLLGLAKLAPDERSLSQLYQYIRFREHAGLHAAQYKYDLWSRLFQPLATIIMLCLGIPFVFGSLRSATMGLRLLAGIVVGFSFYTLNEFFGPLSMVYQFPPFLAAILPILLFSGVCGVMIWRTG